MISNQHKRQIKNYLLNRKGKKNNQRYIVFESDDWGSIRMPSKKVYNKLLSLKSISKDWSYAKYDALESKKDLDRLFDVLSNFRDKWGNTAIITANVIMANPDFKKIREADFEKYYFQLFTDNEVINMWKNGYESKIFFPQFHGREHVNVNRWMALLQSGDKQVHQGFNLKTYTVQPINYLDKNTFLPAAIDYDNLEHLEFVSKSISEGIRQFEDLFKFSSLSFTAPNYTWGDEIEKILYNEGVKFIQSSRIQNLSNPNRGKNVRLSHYFGQKTKQKMTLFVRNCYFEPSTRINRKNEVDACLKDIASAFRARVPAIISTHRINYISRIDEKNSEINLNLLEQLLEKILKNWPDVRFISSPNLFEQYNF